MNCFLCDYKTESPALLGHHIYSNHMDNDFQEKSLIEDIITLDDDIHNDIVIDKECNICCENNCDVMLICCNQSICDLCLQKYIKETALYGPIICIYCRKSIEINHNIIKFGPLDNIKLIWIQKISRYNEILRRPRSSSHCVT